MLSQPILAFERIKNSKNKKIKNIWIDFIRFNFESPSFNQTGADPNLKELSFNRTGADPNLKEPTYRNQ